MSKSAWTRIFASSTSPDPDAPERLEQRREVQESPITQASPRPTLPRYHSFERPRAVMLLPGLVLHTSINYFPFPEQGGRQIYLDLQSSPFVEDLFRHLQHF